MEILVPPPLIQVSDMKKYYGWSRREVYRMLNNKEINACKKKRRLYIIADSVVKWVLRHRIHKPTEATK